MLASTRLSFPAKNSPSPRKAQATRGKTCSLLATGDLLFRKGDRRTKLFRVERGALCHYIQWAHGRHEVIEFVFPGDIIGFGHFDRHISAAQAMVETEVCEVSDHDFEDALEADGQLWARHAGAADREFEYRREEALAAAHSRPELRIATLLVALTHMSAREGQEAIMAGDEIASIAGAGPEGLSSASIADALAELERRGLISAHGTGIRIVSVEALEAFAERASSEFATQ